jgi:ABC-type multidrug transport system ATPase subunit
MSAEVVAVDVPSAAPAVRFEDLHMVFVSRLGTPVHALRAFTMDVPEGAVVGLLGPNGSGKTTAISCLLRLLRPQRGEVYLWGERLGADLPAAVRRRIGVLLEDTRLPPFLSVRDALTTVGRVRGLRAQALRTEIDRVVAQARVEPLLDRRVAVLSKGQARRAGLAAALVTDPPLLILDEPSAGLDVSAREEFNDLVRSLRGHERTVLIASHLLGDVESTCTHVAIMQSGRMRLFQTSELLLREARQRHAEKDIYVEGTLAGDLERLGVRFEPSRYPGLVRLVVEEPEHALIGRLAAQRIVPARIEPRVSLVSVYLEMTGGASD